VTVARAHHPRAGMCRIWFRNRPAAFQPRPVPCSSIRHVPRGAFVLYGGRSWDSSYNWNMYERQHRGAVPPVILRIIR
jgi:hypothetical protein